MQIKKSRLMQIIKEELSRLNEADKYADLNLNALALAAKEDPDAMGPFLARLLKKARPFALRKANYNEADAEDGLQDMATAIMVNLHKFKGDSAFTTWANTILKNKIFSGFREKEKESPFAGGGDEGTTIVKVSDASQSADEYEGASPYVRGPSAYIPDPEQELLRKERLGGFEALLSAIENNEIKLNNKEKIVVLNQLSDNPLSVEELADKLGLERRTSLGTISARARTKILNWLDSENINDADSQNIIKSIFSDGIAPGALKEEDHDFGGPFDDYLEEPAPRRRPEIPNRADGSFQDPEYYGLDTGYTDPEVEDGLTHRMDLEKIIEEVIFELMNQ